MKNKHNRDQYAPPARQLSKLTSTIAILYRRSNEVIPLERRFCGFGSRNVNLKTNCKLNKNPWNRIKIINNMTITEKCGATLLSTHCCRFHAHATFKSQFYVKISKPLGSSNNYWNSLDRINYSQQNFLLSSPSAHQHMVGNLFFLAWEKWNR
jgi:hypothetical protein